MKIIKYLLFLFLIIFIAGSIYVATQDGDLQVEEKRTIMAPAPLLYNEVNDVTTWGAWSYWGSEENIIVDLNENTVGETAGFSWKNADLGDGSISTEAAVPYSSIEQNISFETTVTKVTGNLYWKFEPVEGGTEVTWGYRNDLSFKEKLASTLRSGDFGDLLRPKLKRGLAALEEDVIRKMEEYSINVDGVTQHGGGFYMYMTTAAKNEEVFGRATEMIQQVKLFMKSNDISIDGKPFILYNQRDQQSGTSIFSAAVPTPSQVITPTGSSVLNGFLPSQKAVKTTLKGNFKNAPEAWQAAYRYIEENELELKPDASPFAVYFTNPSEEENPALWITEIYIPVL